MARVRIISLWGPDRWIEETPEQEAMRLAVQAWCEGYVEEHRDELETARKAVLELGDSAPR